MLEDAWPPPARPDLLPRKLCMKLNRYLLVIVLSTLLVQCGGESTMSSRDDGRTVIAVYDGDGAAAVCVTAAIMMFRWMEYEVIRIDSGDVNSGDLSGIDLFYFPGGASGPYLRDITEYGRRRLRTMIQSGSGFMAVCAGAYYAGSSEIWEGTRYTEGHLALYKGLGVGPIDEIFEYPDHGMCRINLTGNHPITQNMTNPAWIIYYGGPYFVGFEPAATTVIGSYELTGQPAMIAFQCGAGRVFLTGPHPEWEEDSDRDSVDAFDQFDDRGSDWDLMRRATDWCLGKIR